MNLAIIAAGESSRMLSEGISLPKPLVKIGGQPMIKRIIDIGVKGGASSVKCIVNSKFPELEQYLLKTDFGVPIDLLVKSTPSSMHSLFELSRFLGDEPFCLATSDSVFLEREFVEFLRYSQAQKEADGTLAITGFIDDEKPLCVKLDGNKIIEFKDNSYGLKHATGGLYYFSPSIFKMVEIALDAKIERLRNFLRLLIQNDYTLNTFEFSKIIDVDHAVDIKTAEEFLRDEK
jgi:NDP-sugar pyrophosphorylase family protein